MTEDKKEALEIRTNTRYFRRSPNSALEYFESLVDAVTMHDKSVVEKYEAYKTETYRNMIFCDALNLARDYSETILKALQPFEPVTDAAFKYALEWAVDCIDHYEGHIDDRVCNFGDEYDNDAVKTLLGVARENQALRKELAEMKK